MSKFEATDSAASRRDSPASRLFCIASQIWESVGVSRDNSLGPTMSTYSPLALSSISNSNASLRVAALTSSCILVSSRQIRIGEVGPKMEMHDLVFF